MPDAETDDDALALAYNRGLRLEKAGDLDGAEAAYREVLALDPADHGGASVRLAAMGRAPSPDAAPPAYVATLFDQNAAQFDDMLVEQLGYAVPMLVRERIAALGLGPWQRMLDLGCGTGLTGASMTDLAREITGVDLAEAMLDEAHERGLLRRALCRRGGRVPGGGRGRPLGPDHRDRCPAIPRRAGTLLRRSGPVACTRRRPRRLVRIHRGPRLGRRRPPPLRPRRKLPDADPVRPPAGMSRVPANYRAL